VRCAFASARVASFVVQARFWLAIAQLARSGLIFFPLLCGVDKEPVPVRFALATKIKATIYYWSSCHCWLVPSHKGRFLRSS
jgi:hypothetical protein